MGIAGGTVFGVSPFDVTTMRSVALLRARPERWPVWVPGRSASRVDPATVLRYV